MIYLIIITFVSNSLCCFRLQNKSSNSDRLFTARGGALLKEAKIRAAFEKGLPKVGTLLAVFMPDLIAPGKNFSLPPLWATVNAILKTTIVKSDTALHYS